MGKDNGVFSYELTHPFEVLLCELYFLSLSDGSINYLIVKDYCEAESLDFLEMYQRVKIVLARVKAE